VADSHSSIEINVQNKEAQGAGVPVTIIGAG